MSRKVVPQHLTEQEVSERLGVSLSVVQNMRRPGGAVMASPFEVRHTPGNITGSLPEHWDLYVSGSDDSIATIWDSQAMADHFAAFLEDWAKRRHAERMAEVRA